MRVASPWLGRRTTSRNDHGTSVIQRSEGQGRLVEAGSRGFGGQCPSRGHYGRFEVVPASGLVITTTGREFGAGSTLGSQTGSDDVGLPDELAAGEALQAERGDIDGGRGAGHELRDDLADNRGVLEAVAGEAVREVEALEALHGAEDRVMVARHLVEPDPRSSQAGLLEGRQDTHRLR